MRLDEAVAEFAERALALRGAIAERRGGAVEALLPPGLRDLFGAEYVRFCCDPRSAKEGEVLLAPGSAEMEKLGSLIAGDGLYLESAADVPYIKKEGLEAAARAVFTFSGVRARFGGSRQVYLPYVTFHLHYTALSDERRDGLVSVSLNEATGAAVEAMDRRPGAAESPAVLQEGAAAAKTLPMELLADKARKLAERRVAAELADFRKSMNRRLARDFARVEEYYRGLLCAAGRRKSASPEKAEEKRKALDLDLSAKKKDLDAKYAVRVAISAAACMRLFVPCSVSQWEFARGARTVQAAVVWNPLLKAVEPLACESCGRETFSPGVCDGSHLTCAACERSCGRCGKGK